VSADHRNRLERLDVSGVRMQRMIEQLLDLTRARLAGGIPVRLSEQPLDLAPLVSKITEEIQTAHPASRIELRVDGDCRVRVDADRFEEVVSNVVGNAVSHGDASRPVVVRLSCESDTVRLAIHNHGKPIPPACVPLLFNPFARNEKPDGASAGLGLGLYISERVIDAHEGTLSVCSSAEAGTEFTVCLPRART
jgi:signal transduction histidine kinase